MQSDFTAAIRESTVVSKSFENLQYGGGWKGEEKCVLVDGI